MDIRASKMRARLTRDNIGGNCLPFYNLFHDILQILNLGTDLFLAKQMYEFSQAELTASGGDFTHDYNICFIWIILASIGPFLIQYSSQINILYHKGTYQNNNFDRQGIMKRLYFLLQVTAIGLLFIPMIDIILKIQGILQFILLPLCCNCKKSKSPPLKNKVNCKI